MLSNIHCTTPQTTTPFSIHTPPSEKTATATKSEWSAHIQGAPFCHGQIAPDTKTSNEIMPKLNSKHL